MKFKTVLLILLSYTLIAVGQEVSDETLKLNEAYWYIKNQNESLDFLETKFPKLQLDIENLRTQFKEKYSAAIISINSEYNLKMMAPNLLKNKPTGRIKNDFILSKEITLEKAKSFLNLLEWRLKERTPSSIFETLHLRQYAKNPEKEFDDNVVKKYSISYGNGQQRMLISFKVPESWRPIDKSSNTTYKKFRNKFGKGNDEIRVIIRNREFNNKLERSGTSLYHEIKHKDNQISFVYVQRFASVKKSRSNLSNIEPLLTKIIKSLEIN